MRVRVPPWAPIEKEISVERNGYRHKLSGVRLNMFSVPKKSEEQKIQPIQIPKLIYDPLFGAKLIFVPCCEE